MNTILTIDNGNTNPHVGFFERSSLTETAPFQDLKSLNLSLKKSCQNNSHVKAIISDVGNKKKLHEKLSSLSFEIESTFISEIRESDSFLGMPVFYSETLGDDRLCQAYLAWKTNPKSSVAIIDCGTFTTIDYITEQGFLGGYIFPGPQTYLDSFQKGSNLPILELQKSSMEEESLDTKQVPQSTEDAILGSLSVFHQGVLTFIKEKLTPDKIILTGGKASNLLPHLLQEEFLKKCLDYRPTFIHEALFQILQDYENQ